MNVFDLAPFRECYEHQSRLNRKAVQKAFDDLNKGYFIEVDEAGNENKVYISDLNNSAAEMIISNMYRNEFGVGNKSIAQIRSEGLDAFKVEYTSARYSSNYDIEFMTTSG
jgi:hypothetical protein